MMHYLLAFAGLTTLAAAHGLIDSITIDGTLYVKQSCGSFRSSLIKKRVIAILPLIPDLTSSSLGLNV